MSDCGDVVVLMLRALVVSVAIFGAGLAVSGCAEEIRFADKFSEEPIETSALPETVKLVREGKRQFTAGHYGLAIDAYAKSIEIDALNAEAWLGLAASYDQMGRFDKADFAYGKAQGLIGSTPSVLNNLGYSYLLRGNLDKSRATLAAAYQGDPGNPYVLNNIEILNERLTALGHPPMIVN